MGLRVVWLDNGAEWEVGESVLQAQAEEFSGGDDDEASYFGDGSGRTRCT
jgi:hypothetical protein